MESHSQLMLHCYWLVLLSLKAIQQGATLQCDTISELAPAVTISVASKVSESALELSCFSSTTPLLNNQYLKWTEMGRELSPSAFIITTSSSAINATAINATISNYGVYTCRCYNNFSVAEMEYIYYKDKEYKRHCSEPVSITVLPTDLATSVASIHNHTVTGENDSLVVINCSNETSELYDAKSVITDEATIGLPFSSLIDSPSKQGKYVCIDLNQELEEIHYITIQGYEPPLFLIPSIYSSGRAKIASSDGVVPVCAVYSSIPVVSMRFYVIINGLPIQLTSAGYVSETGVTGLAVSGITMDQISHYAKFCQIHTVWDTIEMNYNIILEETMFEPPVCLYAGINPISPILFGESVTVSCVLYSLSHIENFKLDIFHRSNNGIETRLSKSQSHGTHDTKTYRAVIDNASNTSIGEYVCRLHLLGYNITKEASVWINEVEAQGFSFPIENSSTMAFPSRELVITQTLAHSSTMVTAEGTPASPLYSRRATLYSNPTSRPGNQSQDGSLVVVYAVISTTVVVVSISAVILVLAFCFMRKRSHESVIVTPKPLPKAIDNEYVTINV